MISSTTLVTSSGIPSRQHSVPLQVSILDVSGRAGEMKYEEAGFGSDMRMYDEPQMASINALTCITVIYSCIFCGNPHLLVKKDVNLRQ